MEDYHEYVFYLLSTLRKEASLMKIFNIVFRGYRPFKVRISTIPKSSYKDGRYMVSKHAIAQMNKRKVSLGQLHYNLHTRVVKTPIKYDNAGRPSYKRISNNNIISSINPRNKNVTSVWRVGSKRMKTYIRRYKK